MVDQRTVEIVMNSFFDGISGAGLFGKLRRPGAPTVLVDTGAAASDAEIESRSNMILRSFRSDRAGGRADHGQEPSFSRTKP